MGTQGQESSRWPTLAPTPTAPSSSSALPRPSGWTGNMSSLVKLSRVWRLSRRSRALDPSLAKLQRGLWWLTVVSVSKDQKNLFDLTLNFVAFYVKLLLPFVY